MKKRQEVYDLYWYFACERQNIFWKKLNGDVAPWTEDKILQTFKFCNSYRVNDRVSQYLLCHVIYNGKKYSYGNMIFRIVLFKLFNKESTWELLRDSFGDVTLDKQWQSAVPLCLKRNLHKQTYLLITVREPTLLLNMFSFFDSLK